jgi:hypothetical protein
VVSIIGDPQGQPQTSLKVLQGSQWVDPPGGALADVYSLSVVDGQMYAGRTTGELLRHENGTFVSLGVVAPAAVRSVARFGGRLHAGLSPRGLVNSPSVSPIAIQLNGVWKQATTFFAVRAPAFVAAMEVHDGELYVAGGGVDALGVDLAGGGAVDVEPFCLGRGLDVFAVDEVEDLFHNGFFRFKNFFGEHFFR